MRSFRGCSGEAEGGGPVVDDMHILRPAGLSAVVRRTRNGGEWSREGRAPGLGSSGRVAGVVQARGDGSKR